MIQDSLHDGSALECFIQMAISQGVEPSVFESEHSLCLSLGLLDGNLQTTEIKAPNVGFVTDINAMELALVALDLGAGRKTIEVNIDHSVGFLLEVELGQTIEAGEPWITVHHRGELDQRYRMKIEQSIKIENTEFEPLSRIDSWIM